MTTLRKRITAKNVLIALIAFGMVAVLLFGTPKLAGTPSTLACGDLEDAEVARSQDLLKTTLLGTITTSTAELKVVLSALRSHGADLAAVEVDLMAAEDDLADEEEDRNVAQAERTRWEAESEQIQSAITDAKAALLKAEDADADQVEIDALVEDIRLLEQKAKAVAATVSVRMDRIAALNGTIGALNATIGALKESITAVSGAIDGLDRRKATLEARIEAKSLARSAMLATPELESESQAAQSVLTATLTALSEAVDAKRDPERIGSLSDDIVLLEATIESLIGPVWARDTESGTIAYLPPRSDVSLVPAEPVSHIELGSHRIPSSVSIVLGQASIGESETLATPGEDVTVQSTSTVELPDKATYFVEAGQFHRGAGPVIPEGDISVWARRVGNDVIMSVCITPDRVHPGMYTGDVYIVDPSLNPTKVRVEVTAQSVWINDLYYLMLILPLLALVYVWVTARHSAGANPWSWKSSRGWRRKNSVGMLVVGFAAVWATLQVPLSNPTWGTSWVNAAAVIGVGLVAAVTAMTVVAGPVIDNGAGAEDETSTTPGTKQPESPEEPVSGDAAEPTT